MFLLKHEQYEQNTLRAHTFVGHKQPLKWVTAYVSKYDRPLEDSQGMYTCCCPRFDSQFTEFLYFSCAWFLFSYVSQPFNWHQPGMSTSKRKLLQSLMGPYGPLSVSYNGKSCILFKAKRLAIRYRNHTFIDLTEKVFNTIAPVDTKGSICTKEKAT